MSPRFIALSTLFFICTALMFPRGLNGAKKMFLTDQDKTVADQTAETQSADVESTATNVDAASDVADAGTVASTLPGGTLAEIVALCATSKKAYAPVELANLNRAEKKLLAAIGFLEKRLAEDGANGKAWASYLKLDELKKQLAAKRLPNAASLAAIQQRFDGDNEGLNLVWFVEVRRALWRYRTIADALNNPQIKAGFDSLLSELPSRLEQYGADPTASLADQIGAVVAWMEALDQAEALISAIDGDYRRPNLFLGASHGLIAEGMSRKVDQDEEITDCILGVSIRGQGHTTGNITAEMIPNGREAVIQMVMKAQTLSKNVGYRGVVRIFSDTVTTFTAKKRFFVNDELIRSEPATCQARCETTVTGICATNGMRLIENVARRRVQQSQCRAEWIAARHAESRISRQFDAQAAQLLAEANESYVDRFRRPLWQRGLFPGELVLSSAKTGLDVTVRQAEINQLAALSLPPQVPGSPDLALRLHESFINNTAAEALAGRTLNEEEMLAMLKDIVGKVPEHLKAEEGAAPWAISFAAEQPIVLRFDDDCFTIKLSIDAFARDGSDYPGMDITAHYKIEKTADGYKAVRQGEVTILPPGFELDKDSRLSIRQQTLRELIGRRFDKAFRTEIVPEPLELPGKWKKLGRLPLTAWHTSNGWIVTTWKLAAQKADQEKSKKAEK